MTDSRRTRRFEADRGDDGRRLDHVLVRRLADLPELSRSLVRRWLDEGRVRIGDEPERRGARRLRHRERVEVQLPRSWSERPAVEAEPMELEVIWEDDQLLVIDKPAGLVVHPTWGHRCGTLLNGLLWRARDWPGGQRPHLVHRLDQDTSGVLVVAKSSEVAGACGRAWQRRRPVKQYLAVVRGRPRLRKGRIERELVRDPEYPGRRYVAREGGQASLTTYELLDEGPLSLLLCGPLTGRTHQIRAHLASEGLPLVGDPVYGERRDWTLSEARLEELCRAFPRQALHAWRLRMHHPGDGRPLLFEAPVPEDLRELLDAVGLELREPGNRSEPAADPYLPP